MTRLFGIDDEFGEDALLGRLEGMKDVIERVNKQFKDPVRQNHMIVVFLSGIPFIHYFLDAIFFQSTRICEVA